MIKVGITGSLASGKTTASKIISFRSGPLFSADKAVKELYKNKHFKSLISKRFKIKNKQEKKMFEFENHDNYFHVKASGKLTHENYVDHLTPKFE